MQFLNRLGKLPFILLFLFSQSTEIAVEGQFFSSMLQAVFLNLNMAGWGILGVAVHTSLKVAKKHCCKMSMNERRILIPMALLEFTELFHAILFLFILFI